MAKQSIIAFSSPHGGVSRVEPYKIAGSTSYSTAETSWVEGEVVILQLGAGVIGAAQAVIDDGPENHNPIIHFIAATSSEGEMSMRNIASAAATINALGRFIPVRGEQEFMTRNVHNNADAITVPTIADVGNTCGWWRDNTTSFGINGRFGIDTNGTGLIITRVLDANYDDIGQTGNAGVFAVFKASGE